MYEIEDHGSFESSEDLADVFTGNDAEDAWEFALEVDDLRNIAG